MQININFLNTTGDDGISAAVFFFIGDKICDGYFRLLVDVCQQMLQNVVQRIFFAFIRFTPK